MSINETKETEKAVMKHLDIRGRVCPMTFVYTKLSLEKLNRGDILEVLLDFLPAVKNVPENCKRQNLAELLEVKEIDPDKNTWVLKLKKL
ncbi:MAG: sulfurtransferase TusA family protein [Candidatus Odinarchaeota archaeon]